MESRSKKKLALGGAAALVLLLAAAWAIGLIGATDPAVAEVQRLFDESMKNGEPPPRDVMRERMDGLTEDQRRQFFQQNRDQMREAMTRRMTETLALPPEELQQEVAERADRILERRAGGEEPERRGPPGGGPPGGRGGPGGPGWGDMSQADRMKRVLGFTTPEMRGAFTEMKRMIDDELEARGEKPATMREMRGAMRGGRG